MSGIGLSTPRGSGTSGHVQKNVISNKLEGTREKRRREAAEEQRRLVRKKTATARKVASLEIKTHDQRRQIEVQCMELRESLEEQELDDNAVDEQVKLLRGELMEKLLKKNLFDPVNQDASFSNESYQRVSERSLDCSSNVEKIRNISGKNENGNTKYVEAKNGYSKNCGTKNDDLKSDDPKIDDGSDSNQPLPDYVPRYNNR